MHAIERFIRDEKGATAIEYALTAGLISIVIVAALTTVGRNLQAVFYNQQTNAIP